MTALRTCLALATLLPMATACSESKPAAARDIPQTQPLATTRPDLSPRISQNTVVTHDVPYVDNPAPLQTLDIYAPRNARHAPVVLYIHGGEWAKRDKSEVSFKPRFLNDHNAILVSVNYRLSGTDKHPAQVNDVAAAVKWARQHIASYGGDPSRLFLMGHSAGCHLVTLVGLDPRPLNAVGLKPTDLAGVISWSGGAFDLPSKVAEAGMYARYIRQCFGEDPAVWADASPINHIQDHKSKLPFLFVSADGDREGSKTLSKTMADRITAAGGNARWVLLPNKVHRTADYAVGMPGDDTGTILLNFIQKP